MRALFLPIFFVGVFVVACSKPVETPVQTPAIPAHTEEKGAVDGEAAASKAGREQVDADGVVRRGAKLGDATAISVDEAAAKAKELDGKSVKLTGVVESACQPMGCWMVVAGEKGEKVRITSKGHDIFVPKSAAGRVATVEGELKVKTVSKEMAQHYEDERELTAGEARKTFTDDQTELSVSATGLELRPKA